MFLSFQITFAQVFISKRAIKEMHHSLAKQDTLVLNVNFGYPSSERNSSVSHFPDKFTTVSLKKKKLTTVESDGSSSSASETVQI